MNELSVVELDYRVCTEDWFTCLHECSSLAPTENFEWFFAMYSRVPSLTSEHYS
jgi:hypothetical protein